MLEADIPPDDALDTAAVDDEKFRNIASIESALEIFGVLINKKSFNANNTFTNVYLEVMGNVLL